MMTHLRREQQFAVSLLAVLERQHATVVENLQQFTLNISPGDAAKLLPPGTQTQSLVNVGLTHLTRAAVSGARLAVDRIETKLEQAERRTKQWHAIQKQLITLPKKTMDGIRAGVRETFDKDYWENIVNKSSRDRLGATINRSIRQRKPLGDIVQSIEDDESGLFTPQRAARIARTETTMALNAGHYAVNEELGHDPDAAVEGKEWLAIIDNAVRRTHAGADGQVQPTGKPFILGGVHQARYPGDPNLPAGERINCRCVLVDAFDFEGDGAPSDPTDDVTGVDAVTVTDPGNQTVSVETPAAELPPVPTVDPEAGMTIGQKVMHRLDNDPGLNIKHTRALDTAQKHELKRQGIQSELDQLRTSKVAASRRFNDIENEVLRQSGGDSNLAFDALRQNAQANELRSTLSTMVRRETELRKALRVAEQVERDSMLASLALPKEQQMPIKAFGIGVKSKAIQQRADEAARALSRITAKSEARDRLDVVVTQTRERASANGRAKEIFMATKDDVSTHVHEIGHVLEDNLFHAQRATAAFRSRRIIEAGTKTRPMNGIVKGYKYADDELGNEDSFIKAFQNAKRTQKQALNSAAYAGKTYRGGSSEILSMGLEELHRNPVSFARGDPQFFKFIIGVLDGTLLRGI